MSWWACVAASCFLHLLAACSANAPAGNTASSATSAAAVRSASAPASAPAAAQHQVFDDAPTPALAELAAATGVPPEVTAALARARLPIEQVALLVAPADGGAPLVNLNTGTALNPASVMKLVTTAAALDVLGAAYTWRTPVWADGSLQHDTLRGNLYIQGQGDPKLVVERLWLLLQQIRQAGIQHIEGDLVLDNTAFALPPHEAGAFDGEPLRPYNAAPDALLVNFKALVLNFTPDPAQGVARVGLTPPLAGVTVTPTLPLSNSDCGAWHNKLGAAVGSSRTISFSGHYPSACGSKSWALAYAAPDEFAARAIAGMWLQLGGRITGQVRFAPVPEALRQRPPLAEAVSPALTEVIRDINKYSNNVMASQVFLSMGLHATGRGSYDSANATVQQWWRSRLGDAPPPTISNGSGLSRTDRISASSMGAMLQAMWKSPSMSEFVSSMPIAGIDGTLRRSRVRQPGSSHLKTGTLNNASALAGYVLANNGKHYVLVAMANGAGAAAARPAFEALVDWTMERPADAPAASTAALPAPAAAFAPAGDGAVPSITPDMPAHPADAAHTSDAGSASPSTSRALTPAEQDPFATAFPGAYAPQAVVPGGASAGGAGH
ncbi:MAG: D-alanyl-D-alanine carboxypeptidase/D-alanyl-D-alanine-endopeptidase [Brachymonas sp.]|nr:D-alanyl-D-alanine carboxypeptidase/D-alanyl-D-alanine-endopeptidase [Brachymonas sp.]